MSEWSLSASMMRDPWRAGMVVLRYPRLYIYPISTSILTLISSYFYLDIHSQSTVVIQLYLEFHSLHYSASCFRLSFSVSSRTLNYCLSSILNKIHGNLPWFLYPPNVHCTSHPYQRGL